jgi:hypothetical protein
LNVRQISDPDASAVDNELVANKAILALYAALIEHTIKFCDARADRAPLALRKDIRFVLAEQLYPKSQFARADTSLEFEVRDVHGFGKLWLKKRPTGWTFRKMICLQ